MKPTGKCTINLGRITRASVGIHRDFIRVFDFYEGHYFDLPARQAWQLHDGFNNKGRVQNENNN